MCHLGLGLTLHKIVDLYKDGLLLNEITVTSTMLWDDFYIRVSEDMAQIVCHYDVWQYNFLLW